MFCTLIVPKLFLHSPDLHEPVVLQPHRDPVLRDPAQQLDDHPDGDSQEHRQRGPAYQVC